MGRWLPPETELEGEQNDVLKKIWAESKNLFISGFPGSGKSVCLLYAVKTIKDKDPKAKIIFVEFTHSLIKMIKAALSELKYSDVKVVTCNDFVRHYYGSYDFIIADEVQDISTDILQMMKNRAKRVIVGGDVNQSIYSFLKGTEKPATIEELNEILEPEISELTIIHRLNKYIIHAINCFLPNMSILAGKSSMLKRHKSPYVYKYLSKEAEVEKTMEEAEAARNEGKSVGILLPSHENIGEFINIYLRSLNKPSFDFANNRIYNKPDYGRLNQYLNKHGIKLQSVTNGFGSFIERDDCITICTYHSAKGLDFETLFLPFCNRHIDSADDAVLFMVAMARCIDQLYISFTSEMNRFIRTFYNDRKACVFTDLTQPQTNVINKTQNDEDDDW